jgi:retron-type reverse transcriptase
VFIFDSYANRKGKGTHAAVDRLTHFMQNADWCLKCDIFRYFPAVDHAILKSLARRKIGCSRTLWLIDNLIDSSNPQENVNDYYPGDDLFSPFQRRRGLPIGNQTSQFFANVYLNPLDHFVKEQLGCHYYIRYVDDFVILADDRTELHETRAAIAEFLATRLRLRMHAKKQTVTPVTCGVDFLGYTVFPTHRRVRRSSAIRFARNLRQMQCTYRQGRLTQGEVKQRVAGWIGHAVHADTYGLRAALFEKAVFSRA